MYRGYAITFTIHFGTIVITEMIDRQINKYIYSQFNENKAL